MKKKTFSKKDINIIFDRADWKCEICGCQSCLESVPHHAFFKSKYFKNDVNDDWNGICICIYCHKIVHFGSSQFNEDMLSFICSQINKLHECVPTKDNLRYCIDDICKKLADKRKTGEKN